MKLWISKQVETGEGPVEVALEAPVDLSNWIEFQSGEQVLLTMAEKAKAVADAFGRSGDVAAKAAAYRVSRAFKAEVAGGLWH